ncbi:MAG: class I tRNA ligase family protein, partial [Nanoarchaeota archaeon]
RDSKLLKIDEPFISLFNQGVVYKDGKKMSKSHGNVVSQDEIATKHGIDTARFYLLFLATPDKEVEWSDLGIDGTFRFLNKFAGLFEEYKEKTFKAKDYDKSKSLESKRNIAIREVTKGIEEFRHNLALISLMDFVNYISAVRERVDEKTLKLALETACLLSSPFIPHIAEECWSLLGNKPFVSLEKWLKYDEKKIDESLHYLEEYLDNVKKDVVSVLELACIEKPQKITLIVSEKWKYDLLSAVKTSLEKTKNPAEIIKAVMQTELRKHGQEIMKLVPKLIERIPPRIISQKEECSFLESEKESLRTAFNIPVEVVLAEESSEQKAKQALPGKPAIVVK